MLSAIAEPGDGDGQDECYHEDGDGMDLGLGGFVAELG